MSSNEDINGIFNELIQKHPDIEEVLLTAKFGVFESLDWEWDTERAVKEMIDKGFEIDGNMRCYLSNE